MVSTTVHSGSSQRRLVRIARFGRIVAACCLAGAAALALAGCSAGAPGASTGAASTEASTPAGQGMAGAAQKVIVSRQALEARPNAWVLSTPESAVRSYLAWTSYAYRTTESSVATPTMSAKQEVHVDSYIQLNLQKNQLIDQQLVSITFGQPSVEGTHTLLPAKEKWEYRYVSTEEVGKTVGGPYTAAYDTTYTVVKTGKNWVVDSVAARAVGTVK